MSGNIERLRRGTTRTRNVRMKPGKYHDGNDHIIVADMPFTIDVEERFDYLHSISMQGEIDWHVQRYIWPTMKPVDRKLEYAQRRAEYQARYAKRYPSAAPVPEEPAHEPEPEPRVSWWRRLLGLGPKLPVARVVER